MANHQWVGELRSNADVGAECTATRADNNRVCHPHIINMTHIAGINRVEIGVLLAIPVLYRNNVRVDWDQFRVYIAMVLNTFPTEHPAQATAQ